MGLFSLVLWPLKRPGTRMMKPLPFFVVALSALALASCGPAAEDRNVMHSRAKVFQDSIANEIRMRMMEAETPAHTTIIRDSSAKQITPGIPAGTPGR
jgi:hypothetical protein